VGVPIVLPWFGIWGVSIVPSLGGNVGWQNVAGRITLEDINGDGLVDHVLTPGHGAGLPPPTDQIFARLNTTGGANLLREVSSPFGARMALTYQLVGNRVETLPGGERVDLPSARYVLSSVQVPGTTEDSVDPTPEHPNTLYTTSIAYGGGFYDRLERDDYGFSSVTVCNTLQTCTETRYNNQSYLLRGTVAGSFVRDSAGRRTSGTETVYETITAGMPAGITHVRPRISRQFIYDGVTINPTGPSITTEVERVYDSAGRLQSIIDRGEAGSDDDVYANITSYFTAAAPYNIVRPKTVELRNSAGLLLRRREATFGALGQLSQITDRLTGGINPDLATPAPYSNYAVKTTFTYDAWGNVETVTDPAGLVLEYAYDSTKTHRTAITDSFGLTSSMEYDMRFGVVKKTTDSNGQKVRVFFDGYGRTTEVYGPYDEPFATAPTISYEYMLQPGVSGFPRAWAITHHQDVGRTTTIDTVTFIDRTMRVIQTKKSAELESGSGSSTTVGWVVSGPVEYDSLGRASRQYRGGFDSTASAAHFVDLVRTPTDPHSHTEYDAFDRARIVRAPDATQVSTDYFVEPIPGQSTARLHTRVTDPLGHARHTYARADGAVLEVRENNTVGGSSVLLRTRYSYDVLGRLEQVIDANNNPTTATYDSLGRMISLDNRDSGLVEYHYTAGGDLGAKVTPNLRAATPSQRIRYVHDKHRLTQVVYPGGRTVDLYYGGPGAWLMHPLTPPWRKPGSA
jgi:YD repeat-containing protein